MCIRDRSILIVFVVTLPVIALQTQAGLANVDPQLLEMAQVFRIRGWKRFWNLYLSLIHI